MAIVDHDSDDGGGKARGWVARSHGADFSDCDIRNWSGTDLHGGYCTRVCSIFLPRTRVQCSTRVCSVVLPHTRVQCSTRVCSVVLRTHPHRLTSVLTTGTARARSTPSVRHSLPVPAYPDAMWRRADADAMWTSGSARSPARGQGAEAQPEREAKQGPAQVRSVAVRAVAVVEARD
eukprot:2063209-Rhodomonas_salina.3